MECYTVSRDGRFEFTEKKSVFIGRSFFVTSPEEAAERLETVRQAEPEARHHVWAYSLREGGAKRFSDAGEPSGTAGMPTLKVLELSGLTDVLITVTRYFGGILLGAGGLARAYTRSAAGAVEAGGRAQIVRAVTFQAVCGYDLYRSLSRVLADAGADISDTSFSDSVMVTASLPEAEFFPLRTRLEETFYTNLRLTVLSTAFVRRSGV